MEKRALAFVACRGAFAKCNLVGKTRQNIFWNSEVSRSRLASTALPVATINGNICHGCGEGTRRPVGNETGKKVIFQKFWAAVYGYWRGRRRGRSEGFQIAPTGRLRCNRAANSSEGEAVRGNTGYNEEKEKGKSVKGRGATGNAGNRGAEREERETESHGADASEKKRRVSFGKLPAAASKSNESDGSENVAGKGSSEGNASAENRKLPSEDSSVATTADGEGGSADEGTKGKEERACHVADGRLYEEATNLELKELARKFCVHLVAYIGCAVIVLVTVLTGYFLNKSRLTAEIMVQVTGIMPRVPLRQLERLRRKHYRALNIKREFILKMASNYRYTQDSKYLTPQQRAFYEKNGYLVFPRLVSQDSLDRYHRRFDDIISGKGPRDGITVMYDVKDRKSVNKIQDLTHDEVFDGYFRHKDILNIVEAFTGPNIMAIHSMLIAKPPDVGFGSSKHPPHQDLYYFPIRPAHKIVASWTAMEPCVRENGCLYVAPGTHTYDRLYKHDYAPGSEPGTVNKFYHGILDLPESVDWVHLEMKPGDTVFFHPLLIHGSGVNMSKRTRRAISCHYAAADCDYVEVSEMGKSRITEELMEYVHKRYPDIEVSYQDLWRAKSTLARGIRSNL